MAKMNHVDSTDSAVLGRICGGSGVRVNSVAGDVFDDVGR